MIDLTPSIKWPIYSWERCWEKKIKISDFLPQKGDVIDLEMNKKDCPPYEGVYHYFWIPPHSEHNTFDDRPYEFLKTQLVRARVKGLRDRNFPDCEKVWIRFEIEDVASTVDFSQCVHSNISDVLRLLNRCAEEINSREGNVSATYFGDYVQVEFRRSEISSFELMLKWSELEQALIFFAHRFEGGYIQLHLSNIKLAGPHLDFFAQVLAQAEKDMRELPSNLADDEIFGMDYM